MKNAFILALITLLVSATTNGQELANLDFISPFHEGFAAVKSGEQWGFIDSNGMLTVDFRDDLVIGADCPMNCCAGKMETNYPLFRNNRSMIKKVKDGIIHYGYINNKGEIIIEPKYINATHFNEAGAIVHSVVKESLGRNEILGKNVVSYSYSEVVIDDQGVIKAYLRGPFHLLYTKEELRTPPKILSKFLSSTLIAINLDNTHWKIQPIDKN
ncbi:MAG: WG repeat-containing protein [Bacteroidota bacterium]